MTMFNILNQPNKKPLKPHPMPVINFARPAAITAIGPLLMFFTENVSDILDFPAEHSSQTKARINAA